MKTNKKRDPTQSLVTEAVWGIGLRMISRYGDCSYTGVVDAIRGTVFEGELAVKLPTM